MNMIAYQPSCALYSSLPRPKIGFVFYQQRLRRARTAIHVFGIGPTPSMSHRRRSVRNRRTLHFYHPLVFLLFFLAFSQGFAKTRGNEKENKRWSSFFLFFFLGLVVNYDLRPTDSRIHWNSAAVARSVLFSPMPTRVVGTAHCRGQCTLIFFFFFRRTSLTSCTAYPTVHRCTGTEIFLLFSPIFIVSQKNYSLIRCALRAFAVFFFFSNTLHPHRRLMQETSYYNYYKNTVRMYANSYAYHHRTIIRAYYNYYIMWYAPSPSLSRCILVYPSYRHLFSIFFFLFSHFFPSIFLWYFHCTRSSIVVFVVAVPPHRYKSILSFF